MHEMKLEFVAHKTQQSRDSIVGQSIPYLMAEFATAPS